MLPLTSYVTSGKSLILFGLEFPALQHADNNYFASIPRPQKLPGPPQVRTEAQVLRPSGAGLRWALQIGAAGPLPQALRTAAALSGDIAHSSSSSAQRLLSFSIPGVASFLEVGSAP